MPVTPENPLSSQLKHSCKDDRKSRRLNQKRDLPSAKAICRTTMDSCDAPNEPGLLYILQEGNGNYYKVGVSKNEESMKSRLQNLQSGNWRKLTKLQASQVSNMNLAEKYAHDQLEDLQVQAGGGTEWFKGSLATIKRAVDEAVKKYPPK